MDTLNFLLGHPVAAISILVIGALIGATFERLIEKSDREKRRAYWRGRNAAKRGPKVVDLNRGKGKNENKSDFAADQLKIVSKAEFAPRPLLNRSEAKVFTALDRAVIERNAAWQVMAQVSLGEFLTSPSDDAYIAVNSKRVDFALMDENCRVVHALEYQGSGHHRGSSAAARDAVKKEALRKAGIGYHEVVAGHTTPSELRALVEKLIPTG